MDNLHEGSTKREHLTSDKFAETIGSGRRNGRHLHETEHYKRGIKHEVLEHHAFPSHDGNTEAND